MSEFSNFKYHRINLLSAIRLGSSKHHNNPSWYVQYSPFLQMGRNIRGYHRTTDWLAIRGYSGDPSTFSSEDVRIVKQFAETVRKESKYYQLKFHDGMYVTMYRLKSGIMVEAYYRKIENNYNQIYSSWGLVNEFPKYMTEKEMFTRALLQ